MKAPRLNCKTTFTVDELAVKLARSCETRPNCDINWLTEVNQRLANTYHPITGL